MTIRRAVATVLAGTASIVAIGAAQKDPPVADVLRAASEYLATYAPKISGVTLEEEYTLLDVSGGRMSTTQRLSSDVVLLNLAGRVLALRDAHAIDNNALREHQPRITALLVKPSAAAWDQAQAYAGETLRYLKDELIARLNDPTLPLQFVAPENQSRVTYKIDGRKRMDGVEVVGLRFQEPRKQDASYIITTRGKAAASGRLWLEPATGRIHQTELSMSSSTENARVSVTFGLDPGLDLWLPKEMTDVYDITDSQGGVSNLGVGGYNSRRSFEGRASYSNPRLTPIQLAVPK